MSKALIDSFLTWEQIPQEEKEVPSAGKSEEEIAKYTVDERLSEVERTVLYLNNGIAIQQRHAIRHLPGVIRGRGRQAWDAINQALKATLNKLDAEAQIEAAEAFVTLVSERLMGTADLQACLLPIICRNINKEKSEEEIEAWLQALFVLIPLLDKEVLKSEVAALALSKGDVAENLNSRCICARILGAVSKCLTRDEIERTFFKKVMSMCQDVDYHVRIATCQQLVAIGRAVGGELLSKQVLEELLELLKDEEVQVRTSAFTSLTSLLEILPQDVRKTRLMPVLREHMQPFDLDLTMQLCVARHFGTLLALIKSDMEPEDPQLFYSCFRHLAARTDSELRRTCAQQLPGVVKAAAAIRPGAYQAQFHDVVVGLVGDVDEGVRVAVAESLHEYARLAGRDAGALLTRPLVRLLRDDSMRVQAAALPKLDATLQSLVAGVEDSRREALLADVVKALVELEAATANRRWRVQEGIAQAFPSFPRALSSDQIYEHFVPMALRLLSSGAASVRPAAAEGVAQFLRYGRKERQRAELFLRLVREHARGKSFSMRVTFVHVAQHMLAVFSSKFIKEWVFDLCLELLYDPVPNVRLQVTPLLPALKQAIRLPEDVDLLERLNNAMSNAMTDNDRDVSVGARAINDAFKRTPVRMGMGTQVVEVNGLLGGAAGYEAMDRKREEEEAELASFNPEDAKEIRSEISQVGIRRRVVNGSGIGQDASGRAVRRSGSGSSPAPTTPSTRQFGTSASPANGPGATKSAGTRAVPVSQRAGGVGASTTGSAARAGAGAGAAAAAARPGSTSAGPPKIPAAGAATGGATVRMTATKSAPGLSNGSGPAKPAAAATSRVAASPSTASKPPPSPLTGGLRPPAASTIASGRAVPAAAASLGARKAR